MQYEIHIERLRDHAEKKALKMGHKDERWERTMHIAEILDVAVSRLREI